MGPKAKEGAKLFKFISRLSKLFSHSLVGGLAAARARPESASLAFEAKKS
jgi:hypothetical protein